MNVLDYMFLALFLLFAYAVFRMIMSLFDESLELTHAENKAREYEKKADRLRSIVVLLTAFPFAIFRTLADNLTMWVERYNQLAKEWREFDE